MGIPFVFRTILLAALVVTFAGSKNAVCLQQNAREADSNGSSQTVCAGESCASVPAPSAIPATATVPAGAAADNRPQETDPETRMTFKKVFVNLPGDQKTIWTSPFHLRWKDSLW